jgi:hypothetical protein
MDQYSERLYLLYALCLADSGQLKTVEDAPKSDMLEAATFLACLVTVQAIRHLGRTPHDEMDDTEALSVYQAFAMLVFVYLILPLQQEGEVPDIPTGAVMIGRSLFAELPPESLAECLESGDRKFQLIGNAKHEHWMDFREDMDKTVIAFVVAGTDDSAPFDKEELIPVFATMLNQLCEAFEN